MRASQQVQVRITAFERKRWMLNACFIINLGLVFSGDVPALVCGCGCGCACACVCVCACMHSCAYTCARA